MAHRRLKRALLPIAAVLAVVACGSDVLAPEDIEFVDELEIDLSVMTRTASGLYIQDLTVGDGALVESGDSVAVDYSGWLPNGALFDSGTDFPFSIGVGRLIAGIDEGVIGMRVGGTRALVIPPALGYGDRVIGGIPANSTLVFRVTVKAVLVPSPDPAETEVSGATGPRGPLGSRGFSVDVFRENLSPIGPKRPKP